LKRNNYLRNLKKQDDTEVQPVGTSLMGIVKEVLEKKTFHTEIQGEVETNYNDGWHYGTKLELEPQIIMEGITETLLELDTTYVIKSPNYRIKCFHKLHRASVGIQAIESDNVDSAAGNGNGINPPPAADKFTKNELVFVVQIYSVPNSKEYVVDLQRTKGHTIIFLEYCQKLMNILKKKLYSQNK